MLKWYGNYQLFINENNSCLSLPNYFQFKQLSSVFFYLHFINEHNNEQNVKKYNFKVIFLV